MVIRLDIEIWEIGKGGTKRGCWKRGGWVGKEVWGLLGIVAFVCVWVYLMQCHELVLETLTGGDRRCRKDNRQKTKHA
jgi:hypothetical protein